MPEKITYEEILIENLTKAVKDVVEQINENDLWSGLGAKIHVPKTPHTSPMHDTKDDGDIQKVTRPKAEKVAEKNPVGGVISKAPPINDEEMKLIKDFRKDYDKLMDAVHYLSVMRGSSQEDDAFDRLGKVYTKNQDKWGG